MKKINELVTSKQLEVPIEYIKKFSDFTYGFDDDDPWDCPYEMMKLFLSKKGDINLYGIMKTNFEKAIKRLNDDKVDYNDLDTMYKYVEEAFGINDLKNYI